MKLSDDQVSKIRALAQAGNLTNAALAKRFGVSAQQIAAIKAGKSRSQATVAQMRSAEG